VEGPVLGRPLLERALPVALEVDGIGQDQPGQAVEDARLEQLLDLVLGLLLDPGVDAPT